MNQTRTIQYFDIAWLSHCDGPGRRVVVFLQGCHLRCPWCHSPHSHESKSPLLFFSSRCLRCGRCAKACPESVHGVSAEVHELRREGCRRCGRCVDACLMSSRDRLSSILALPTKELTVADLWDLLYPQLDLLRAIGGITLSGGEPLLQSEALRQLLHLCRQAAIHTAVETCGTLPVQCLDDAVQLVDCWLFGLRPTPVYVPPQDGVIEDNLAYLTDTQSRVILRTPVVAGITDLPRSLEAIAASMHSHRLTEIELLPFHAGTTHYYDALGTSCPVGSEAIPSAERLAAVREYFERSGFMARIVR